MKNKRMLYPDLLRILASFLVVLSLLPLTKKLV